MSGTRVSGKTRLATAAHVICCVICCATTAWSQDTDKPVTLHTSTAETAHEVTGGGIDLFRAAEMPGHRSLLRLIGRDETEIRPFTTDGCSGGMSAGWSLIRETYPNLARTRDAKLPWAACCETHDRAYHRAGGATDPTDSYAARLAADEALKSCVQSSGAARVTQISERFGLTETQVTRAFEILGQSMFNAVRLGGGPCSGLPWRWGYGYVGCTGLLR